MSFWGELKRRNVFKVGAAYVIVAWLIVQVANTFFPLLSFPKWAVPLVAVLVILGFPLALLFAWAFELTADGIKKTEHVPLEESLTHVTGRKLNYVLAGLLVIAVGYIVIDKVFLSPGTGETEMTPPVAEQAVPATEVEEAPKTIAVLPFDDLSPEKNQEYFVVGLSEEILNSLAKIPDLLVTAKTSSFAFKDTSKTVQEIAEVLGVAHILEGSVRKAGDALRITVQLIRASDGFHLWSETYNRKLEDIFAVQEDIATAVANELKLALGIGSSLKQLGGTENIEAYELFLVAKGKFSEDTTSAMTFALESINEAIALDPEFALAWAVKAFFHSRLSISGPANRAFEERDAALHAALKSIEIEPNLPDGHFQLGWMKTTGGNWIEAETSYRRALKLTTEQFPEYSPYPLHYFALGYFVKAKNLIKDYLQVNPFNQNMRSFYMMTLGILGDFQGAEEEYGKQLKLFGDQIRAEERILLFFMGADNVLSIDDIPDTDLFYSQVWKMVKKYLESPEEGLLELKRLYAHDENLTTFDFMSIALLAAYFGDPEFAIEPMKKELSINAVDFMYVWLPVMHDVRQLPKFNEFVREIGLVDYWEKFGWPDICHKLENGDFECE